MSWPEIVAARDGGVVGRPHIARALVDAGSADSVDHAFATLLHHTSPFYVAKADTDVLAAHRPGAGRRAACRCSPTGWPPSGDGSSATTPSPRWPPPGCSAWRSTIPITAPHERAHLRGLAADLGLLVTGSSDYHGHNKTTAIGAELTAPDQLEALLAAGTGSRALPGLSRTCRCPRLPCPAWPGEVRRERPARPARHAHAAVLRPPPASSRRSPTARAATASPISSVPRRRRGRRGRTTRSVLRCTPRSAPGGTSPSPAAHRARPVSSCTPAGRRTGSGTRSRATGGARGPPAG